MYALLRAILFNCLTVSNTHTLTHTHIQFSRLCCYTVFSLAISPFPSILSGILFYLLPYRRQPTIVLILLSGVRLKKPGGNPEKKKNLCKDTGAKIRDDCGLDG